MVDGPKAVHGRAGRICAAAGRFGHAVSRPGKPTDNAVIESFNGRLRDECLNQHWFLSLDEAKRLTEAWREDSKRVRPHASLGHRTPFEFARLVDGHAHPPALSG
jgi:transposase InsO family protein